MNDRYYGGSPMIFVMDHYSARGTILPVYYGGTNTVVSSIDEAVRGLKKYDIYGSEVVDLEKCGYCNRRRILNRETCAGCGAPYDD